MSSLNTVSEGPAILSQNESEAATTQLPPESKRRKQGFLIAVCLVVAVMAIIPVRMKPRLANDHYVYLSHNFVQGRLSVDDLPRVLPDRVDWQGHKYLPIGPLPAVLLIPFLPLLENGVRLVWVGYLFTLLNLWLFYRVLGRIGITGERRKWALLLFFGSTPLLSVTIVGISYFFAHIVTITFLLLGINETLGKRRPWLVGLLLGMAAMCRFIAVCAAPFFIWMLWRGRANKGVEQEEAAGPPRPGADWGKLAFVCLAIGLGLALPALLLLAYNYLRFGNPFESGYGIALLGGDVTKVARAYGLFSIVHVPKNLFMMLLQGPVPWPDENTPVLEFPFLWPSPWGMGLFFTSPALVYIFNKLRSRLSQPLTQACLLGVISVAIPTMLYYGVGWIQFGYRYALDFMPFLVILAAQGFPKPMSRLAIALVLIGVAVNLWGSYWLALWI
jgi:hypothetical protein